MWALCGVALVAIVGWIKAWRDAKDWEVVCICLGDQYDRLQVEHYRQKEPKPEQRSMWLN